MKNKAVAAFDMLSPKKLLFVAALFLVLGVLIYSNTWHAEFQFDDAPHIKLNVSLRGSFDVAKIWNANIKTRFIPFVTLTINFLMGREGVAGYHFFNFGVHFLNACWVFLFGVMIFRTPKMSGAYPPKLTNLLAIFSALIFLAHPLQTQAVTYIIQRMASLAAFFYLGAIVLYMKARLDSSKAFYAGSLAMAFAAMFCKENATTLPLAIILVDLAFFIQTDGKMKALLRWAPFFAAVLSALCLSGAFSWIFSFTNSKEGGLAIKSILPADLQQGVLSRGQYFLTQINVLCTYLRLLIFPVNQSLDYDYRVAKGLLEVRTMASALFLTGLVSVAFLWIKKHRLLSFGIFWFFLTLSVESSIIPIRDVIVEHRMYLPMAGCALFICAGLYEFLKDQKQWVVAVTLVVITLASLTYARNEVWKTRISMWQDVTRKAPQKARGFSNLGDSYGRAGQQAKAAECFRKAIELDPDYAEAYYNLGHALGMMGDHEGEKEYYRKAIEKNPEYWSPYINLGAQLGAEGDLKGALDAFQAVVKGNPENVIAYDNLGVTYDRLRNFEKAVQNFNKSVQINPYYAPGYWHLGQLLRGRGDLDGAVTEMMKALEAEPDYAEVWFDLGKTYLMMHKLQEAGLVAERLRSLSFGKLSDQLTEMIEKGIPVEKEDSAPETTLKTISKECLEQGKNCGAKELSEEEKKKMKILNMVRLSQMVSQQQRAVETVKVFQTVSSVTQRPISSVRVQPAVPTTVKARE